MVHPWKLEAIISLTQRKRWNYSLGDDWGRGCHSGPRVTETREVGGPLKKGEEGHYSEGPSELSGCIPCILGPCDKV